MRCGIAYPSRAHSLFVGNGDRTIVAVAGPDEMQALGQLDLIVSRGRIADFVWQRHIPSPSDPVDRATQAAVAKYLSRD